MGVFIFAGGTTALLGVVMFLIFYPDIKRARRQKKIAALRAREQLLAEATAIVEKIEKMEEAEWCETH